MDLLQRAVVGITAATFTLSAVPYIPPSPISVALVGGKATVIKREAGQRGAKGETAHSHPLHAPTSVATLYATVSSSSGSGHVGLVADNSEFTPGATSAQISAEMGFVATHPFLLPSSWMKSI